MKRQCNPPYSTRKIRRDWQGQKGWEWCGRIKRVQALPSDGRRLESWLHHLLAVWPGASQSLNLNFSFVNGAYHYLPWRYFCKASRKMEGNQLTIFTGSGGEPLLKEVSWWVHLETTDVRDRRTRAWERGLNNDVGSARASAGRTGVSGVWTVHQSCLNWCKGLNLFPHINPLLEAGCPWGEL